MLAEEIQTQMGDMEGWYILCLEESKKIIYLDY